MTGSAGCESGVNWSTAWTGATFTSGTMGFCSATTCFNTGSGIAGGVGRAAGSATGAGAGGGATCKQMINDFHR